MAEPRGAAKPAPKTSSSPTKLSPRSTPQPRPSKEDAGNLARYRDNATASREPRFLDALMPSGTGSARRRGALRELLRLQGAAPAGWLSKQRLEEQSAGGPNGPGGSRLCLEPREHAWMLAAAEGRFEALQELLEAEPGLLLRCDPITGYSVLHWLAKHGRHEELIRVHDFAQRQGLQLNVSAPGSGGLTPLHLAALHGHEMVIKVLVGALGADPTRRDHSGHRACHYLRPDAPWSLRELSGAEDWEMAGSRDGDPNNANNNSSSVRAAAWTLKRVPSAVGARVVKMAGATGEPAKGTGEPAKGKDSVGSQVTQIQGLLHQMFPFFQNR